LAFFSEKGWYQLQGYINVQKNCYWSSQNPHLTHEVAFHPMKVGVWCAVFSKTQLIAKDIYMQRDRIFNTSCDP
jgi:hypothetical protein